MRYRRHVAIRFGGREALAIKFLALLHASHRSADSAPSEHIALIPNQYLGFVECGVAKSNETVTVQGLVSHPVNFRSII
jgi:hypothetical protein